jgi:hypothetical protein
MDVGKVLTDLRRQRADIEEVILNLELLARSRERRRGRPPATTALKKRGRPRGSKNKFPRAVRKSEPAEIERALAAGQSAAPNDNPSQP